MKTPLKLLPLLGLLAATPNAFAESSRLTCEGLHDGRAIAIEFSEEFDNVRANVLIDGTIASRFNIGNITGRIATFLEGRSQLTGGPSADGKFKIILRANSLGEVRASADLGLVFADYEYISADNLEMNCE